MDNQRIDFTPEVIAQQRAICDAATPGPWCSNEPYSPMITAENPYGNGIMHIADIRGWGHLTGKGACALTDEKASEIQANNSKFIVAAKAGYRSVLDALEASNAREAEKDATIARLTAERDAAVCDMFGCMSTQGQCVRCKKRYYCDGTDDDKFSPLCKNKSHCYAWEWRGLHADNIDAPTGAESEG